MVATAIVAIVSVGGLAAHSKRTAVFWSADIAPILEKRCESCHTQSGFGPIPLDSYEDARKWGKEIRQEVLSRRMPPWSAVKGLGDFRNDRSLTPVEIELITSWVDGAMPRGAATDPLSSKATQEAVPNAVVPVPVHVASGVVSLEVMTGGREDRWLAAWEFLPADRALVERATISIAGGVDLGTWTPADRITRFGPGMAQRLPAGATLSMELTYRKNSGSRDTSEAKLDGGQVAFYFAGKPKHTLQHLTLTCGAYRYPMVFPSSQLLPTP